MWESFSCCISVLLRLWSSAGVPTPGPAAGVFAWFNAQSFWEGHQTDDCCFAVWFSLQVAPIFCRSAVSCLFESIFATHFIPICCYASKCCMSHIFLFQCCFYLNLHFAGIIRAAGYFFFQRSPVSHTNWCCLLKY